LIIIIVLGVVVTILALTGIVLFLRQSLGLCGGKKPERGTFARALVSNTSS
jgi:hypothetical protein